MTTALHVLLALLCVVGSPGHLEALVGARSADEELKASRSSLLCCSLMEQRAVLRLLVSPIVMLQIEMKWGSTAVTWPFCKIICGDKEALYLIQKPHLVSVVFLISDYMYLYQPTSEVLLTVMSLQVPALYPEFLSIQKNLYRNHRVERMVRR